MYKFRYFNHYNNDEFRSGLMKCLNPINNKPLLNAYIVHFIVRTHLLFIIYHLPEQIFERRFPYVTALYDRSQNAQLIVKCLAKRPTMVKVNRKRIVAEQGEGFVMMAIHVTHKEVKHGQIHNV